MTAILIYAGIMAVAGVVISLIGFWFKYKG